jgi:hypothetical protein
MSGNIDGTVTIKGLQELKNALWAADPAMKKELRQQFKSIGNILSDEAKAIATSQGLVGTQKWDHHKGRLVKGIHPTATELKVVVNETAKDPKGYRYPKIYEYGGATHVSTFAKGTRKRTSVAKTNASKTATRLGLSAGADIYHGARAFMQPALDSKREEIYQRMEEVTKAAEIAFENGGS